MNDVKVVFDRHARMIKSRTDDRLDAYGILALAGTGLPGEFAEVIEETPGTVNHSLEMGDFLWYAHLLANASGFDFLDATTKAVTAILLPSSDNLAAFTFIGNISDVMKKVAVTRRKEYDDDRKRYVMVRLVGAMAIALSTIYEQLDSTEERLNKVANILLMNIDKLEKLSGEKYT